MDPIDFFSTPRLLAERLTADHWLDLRRMDEDEGFMALIFGGKTVVGGLVGGWIGVELAKKVLGIRGSTGDGW